MRVLCRVEKPPRPTLWLDTSVGIKLAKAVKCELGVAEASQLMKLKALVVRLTLADRLLCVEGDQSDEYGQHKYDKEADAEFARLTLGVSLDSGLAIKDTSPLARNGPPVLVRSSPAVE